MADRRMLAPDGTPVVVGSESERVSLQSRGYTDEPKQEKSDVEQDADADEAGPAKRKASRSR